ncbi:cell division protein FtsX [Candidatus Caldatribacterium saccharofermentans]|uniref:cell division protein FtsX n=1 Tax=Candidatus Caldatribacterium saccharofermentans TaxID=1454753 RepID=UPI003CFF4741
MGRVSRYMLRRPGLFVLSTLSVLLVGVLVNAAVFGYLEAVRLREHWRERFTIRAIFREDVRREFMEQIREEVARHPLVGQVVLVSPEEARARFLERLGLSEGEVAGVSFPASLEVVPRHVEDLPEIAAILREEGTFVEVFYGGKEVEGFLRLFRLLLKALSGFLLGVLGFGVFVIVVTTALTVQLRGREVEVLSLVGAPSAFSLAPFLFEGLFGGLLGGAGAYLLGLAFFVPFFRLVGEAFPGFLWVNVEELLVVLLPLDLGVGCGMGVLGVLLGHWRARRRRP